YDTSVASAVNVNVSTVKEWKWSTGGAPACTTTADRQTTFTYGLNSNSSYTGRHIINLATEVNVASGSTTYADTKFTYDCATGSACTSFATVTPTPTQWTDPGTTARGDVTLIKRLVSGSTYVSTNLYPDTTGQVTKVT